MAGTRMIFDRTPGKTVTLNDLRLRRSMEELVVSPLKELISNASDSMDRLFDTNNRKVSIQMTSSQFTNEKEAKLLTNASEPSQDPSKDRERTVDVKGELENMW